MPEYRLEGISTTGKAVQGVIEADGYRLAKEKANQMSLQRKFKVINLTPRSTFLYKVQRGTEKPVTGEQKAFTKEEVQEALSKMGFRVMFVRKKLFDFKPKPPMTDVVTFVRVCADLIRQKLPYNEILQLMSNDIENKTLRDTIREINNELKQGKDSEKVFLKQEPVFGKFTAHMLGLASQSGNMAEIYESTAKFLERQAQFKKDLKSALIMPLATLAALFGAVVYYIGWIFQPMAEIFVKMKIEIPPMTAATLDVSYFLLDNIIIILIVTAVPSIIAVRFFMTPRGRYILDRFIWKIPVIGSLLHKTSIEIFCRVFHALYSGSGENIEVIKMSAEACGNKYMELQIKNIAIPMMVEKGAGITESFEATGVFTKTALSRFHSGAETGTVKHTAHQLAEYYEKETTYKMRNAIDYIQLWISMIIMVVLTALTLVSSETAFIRPKNPMGYLESFQSIIVYLT
ncbi:MAG: type II secretion system F family protein [Bacteroidetes bacterium]|nr:type II secretion system F family protein [Bacteroidota bacterium]